MRKQVGGSGFKTAMSLPEVLLIIIIADREDESIKRVLIRELLCLANCFFDLGIK